MVSKVAIIAIVAILAVPILLGYALNVDQVTETDYKTTGDSVNVTQLLQSGTDYSYLNANSYEMNSSFSNSYSTKMLPIFNTSSVKSSIRMDPKYTYSTGIHPWFGGVNGVVINSWNKMYYESYNEGSGSKLIGYYRDNNGTLIHQINNLHSIYWDKATMTLSFSYYTSGGLGYYNVNPPSTDYKLGISDTGGYVGQGYIMQEVSETITYVDLSKGYHFLGSPSTWIIDLPNYTHDAIITIDLNSITDDNYSILIGAGGHSDSPNTTDPYYLTKTTTAGVVSWKLTSRDDPSKTWDLYYDPDIEHNTYQIYWDWVYDHTGDPYFEAGLQMDFHDVYYKSHREFRYVGNWPNIIGEANVYWKITDDIQMYIPLPVTPPEPIDLSYNFNKFYMFNATSETSPTVRVDKSLFRAFEYPVIENKTYDAAAFKTNPATTINDPVVYGSSFTFGGITYLVNKGNITMGNHDIPVKGLVLSSVPNPEGGYDNKIGNTVISTTGTPSPIIFNGRWSASISTIAQEEYEVTKTEWKAGDFAWDGIDHNFIMAGLLASLGAFVGVGIYSRRTKTSLWPLLIVCGGAALLFFVML